MSTEKSANEACGQVREVLRAFQEGYSQRNLDALDEFMALFAPDEEIEVIGTGASVPGEEQWCLDRSTARKLVEGDWKHWGDVRLDVDGANIFALGDVAWLATSGTVFRTLETREAYENFLGYIRWSLEREDDRSAEVKVLDFLRGGANTVYEVQRGERYIWPFRFTAVLVRREACWRFHQIQFSFPTTHFPDERNVESLD